MVCNTDTIDIVDQERMTTHISDSDQDDGSRTEELIDLRGAASARGQSPLPLQRVATLVVDRGVISDEEPELRDVLPSAAGTRHRVKSAKWRDWTFTSFLGPREEPDPETDITKTRPQWREGQMRYMVYQLEKCETTGRLHWQGAVKFRTQQRLSAAQTMLCLPRIHMEPARSWDNAVAYCKKTETRVSGPWEFGDNIGQGHRSDLDVVIKLVKADAPLKRIAELCPREYIKFFKGIGAYRMALQEPPGIDRKVCLLVGDTGVGKTRFVMDNFPGNYNVFDLAKPWFDGYDGQEVVLFDECGEGMMHYNILKQLTDRYPFRVPVKGGSVPWMAKVIFLTSNCMINEWYPKAAHIHIRALERRIKTFHIRDDGGGLDEIREYLGMPAQPATESAPAGLSHDDWIAQMIDTD